jgi:hypothetical protein
MIFLFAAEFLPLAAMEHEMITKSVIRKIWEGSPVQISIWEKVNSVAMIPVDLIFPNA